MAGNKVEIEVTAKNTSAAALAEARRDVERLGDESRRTAVKMSDLMGASDRAGKSAKGMGSDFDSATADARQLQRELLELKASMAAIGRDIGDTKIKAPTVSGGGKVRGGAGSLLGFSMAEIERFGGDAGVTAAKALQGGLFSAAGDVFEALPAEVKVAALGAGAAIGAMLATAIGASADAALLGGVGTIGIGAAIIAQAQDEKVTDAWGNAFDKIAKMWTQITTPFAKPIIYSAGVLEKSTEGVVRTIQPAMAGLSKYVVELAAGVGALEKNAAPGFAKAIEASGPVLDALAKELPHLGEVIGDAFAEMSKGSEGAAMGLRTVFKIAETGITAFATMVRWLSEGYAAFIKIDTAAADFGAHILGWVPGLGGYLKTVADKLHQIKDGGDAAGDGLDKTEAAAARAGGTAEMTADDFTALIQKLNAVEDTADTVAGAMTDKLLDGMLKAAHGAIDLEQSYDDLAKSMHDNGKNFDINTQKGRDNEEALLGVVEANKNIYDSMIASGKSAEEAAAAYDKNTKRLHDQLRAAGMTEQQVQDLIGTYGNVPKNVNTLIAVNGLTEALNRLSDLYTKIYNIPDGHFNIYGAYIGPHTGIKGGKEGPGLYYKGGIKGAATGGMRSDFTWVGEQGPELVRLPSGSQVFTAGQSQRMSQQGQGGGGWNGGDYTIHTTVQIDKRVLGETLTYMSRTGDMKIHSKAVVG